MEPREVATPDNHGPIVNVVNWMLLVTMVLAVGTRFGMKLLTTFKVRSDDFAIVAALILSIGETAAVSIQADHGLGKSISKISDSDLRTYQIAQYCDQILFVANVGFARAAVILLLRSITPDQRQRKLSLGLGVLNIIWQITSMLAFAFSCHLPRPWQYIGDNKCINRLALANYICVCGIVLDVALVSIPVMVIRNVQMPKKRKIKIVCCFSSRIFVVPAIVMQLVYINKDQPTQDPSLHDWPVSICSQVVQSLGIVFACIPYLKPFFSSLESGLVRTDHHPLTAFNTLYAQDPDKTLQSSQASVRAKSTGKSTRNSTTKNSSRNSGRSSFALSPFHKKKALDSSAIIFQAHTESRAEAGERRSSWDNASTSSRARIIRQTQTWKVESMVSNETDRTAHNETVSNPTSPKSLHC
ncbi:uncharacterized protein K452DRAFT_231004 [Aplosporella prunicola CBS 121167]|uniref:Rhodopsin domain-containing protein n=1 Tax=Aplosporella prunicola CBS 121167 TaxID=1176127 RepID=A0A6A6BAY9_9PEZI|nr:uncharacterized protein K452DRAFT_231004 [Aplosporella prunicola CBS 121167]KAF2140424.1 hypothetical protein K452DRAFT_231004 [Aplosporella prunicola CBS 121167]